MKYFIIVFSVLLLFSCKQRTTVTNEVLPQKSKSQKVFFKNINDGDTLESPFTVEMGVIGMKIKPAGPLEPGTGHHHIIVDKTFIKYGEIIPMDKTHLHYGKGDTVASIDLTPGDHTLTLQFANGMHMSYGEQFSNSISIYIK